MPTEISNWNELDAIRDDLTDEYVLVNDLDRDTEGYDEHVADGWDPIGDTDNRFVGELDGDGYKIDGLFIDRAGETNTGLFSVCGESESVGATIKNLEIVDAGVEGTGSTFDEGTGILIGSSFGDLTVENVIIKGFVNDSDGGDILAALSGVIREVDQGVVIDSVLVDARIRSTGADKTGFITGYNFDTDNSVIKNVAVNGLIDIGGDDEVGGIIGDCTGEILVENCYSFVELIANGGDDYGAIIGESTDDATVRTCYASPVLDTDGADNGYILIGDDDGDVFDCYHDTEFESNREEVVKLETEEMQGEEASSNMDGFDFDDVYETIGEEDDIAARKSYPTLRSIDKRKQLIMQNTQLPGIDTEFLEKQDLTLNEANLSAVMTQNTMFESDAGFIFGEINSIISSRFNKDPQDADDGILAFGYTESPPEGYTAENSNIHDQVKLTPGIKRKYIFFEAGSGADLVYFLADKPQVGRQSSSGVDNEIFEGGDSDFSLPSDVFRIEVLVTEDGETFEFKMFDREQGGNLVFEETTDVSDADQVYYSQYEWSGSTGDNSLRLIDRFEELSSDDILKEKITEAQEFNLKLEDLEDNELYEFFAFLDVPEIGLFLRTDTKTFQTIGGEDAVPKGHVIRTSEGVKQTE